MKISKPGDKITADVWGPAGVESLGHKRYYLLFQDRKSHEEHIFFMNKKSETLEKYKNYKAWVEVQRNIPHIKIFGSDQGGEFTSNDFTAYLEQQGTVRHLMVHDSPQSNRDIEWANRTHLQIAHAMLIYSQLPPSLWAKAIQHSVWL
jgi:hypothetical protein